MNEIEKLYVNAKVKKYRLLDRDNKLKWVYPEFTAEKQLALIKWLSQYCITIECEDGEYEVYTAFDDDVIENFYDMLEDAIAYYVNKIWQNLAEEEKQNIKEILE